MLAATDPCGGAIEAGARIGARTTAPNLLNASGCASLDDLGGGSGGDAMAPKDAGIGVLGMLPGGLFCRPGFTAELEVVPKAD